MASKNYSTIALFLLPATLIYLLLAISPSLYGIWFAFTKWDGYAGNPLEFVGLRNFYLLLQNKDFVRSLLNIVQFTVVNVFLQISFGYGIAYAIVNIKNYSFFKAAFFIPVVLPIAAVGLLWQFILLPTNGGLLNNLLSSIGLVDKPIPWLLGKITALNSVAIVNAWAGVGYHIAIGFAALSGIPKEVSDAAKIDGCHGLKRALLIELPMIREIIITSLLLIIIGSMKNFDIVFVMTEGGPDGLTHLPATLMYYYAFKYSRYGIGSAISFVILVLSMSISGFVIKKNR